MESSVALDRNHPVPLHLQIKDSLADRIAGGVFAPGGRLPSERQLCDELAVSRATVREALRTLEHEGILRTVPGRGTFIAEPQGVVNVAVSLAGFTADLRRQGMTASSRVLDARLMVSPPADLTHRMRVRPGDEVVKIERLRLANGRPLALHTVYLQHRFCPDVLHHNLAQESLMDLLRHDYGLRLARADEQAYATLADGREMDLLELSYPHAVLRTERTTFLASGDIIEFSQATYRGDSYRLTMALEALATTGTPGRRQ